MDRDGSCKESDLLFKIALDLSKLDFTPMNGQGSYGMYYHNKDLVKPIIKNQLGLNQPNVGLKTFFEDKKNGPLHIIAETLGLNFIAPLINELTNLAAPNIPTQSMSFSILNNMVYTRHFNGTIGSEFYARISNDNNYNHALCSLISDITMDRIENFIDHELDDIGIANLDIHEDNYIIKNELVNELLLEIDILKQKFHNEDDDYDKISLLDPDIEGALTDIFLNLNLDKKICVFDFTHIRAYKESIVGRTLKNFVKTVKKYKPTQYTKSIEAIVDNMLF